VTAELSASEGFTLLLTAASALETSVADIKRNLSTAFAELRNIDAQLTEIGFPTKRPDLLDGEDIDQCLALARDVAARVRRAVAISMAVEGQGGRA
jgi:hypothetical protein